MRAALNRHRIDGEGAGGNDGGIRNKMVLKAAVGEKG